MLGALLLAVAAATGPAGASTPKPSPKGSQHAAPSGTPASSRGVTFGIGAATAKGLDPRRDHLNFLAGPGSSIGDHIVLVNLGYKPLAIAVYTAEALNAANGTIAYRPRADPGREARAWLSIDGHGPSMNVTVPARGRKVLPVSARVPVNATPGDHVVGIMAAVTSKVTTTTGQNPKLEQRIALRAFFRVSGALKPELTITGLKASYDGTVNPVGSGTATIRYTVKNTGNVDLGGKQALNITGLLGSTGSIQTLPKVPLLLPGGSYPVRVVVHDVFPGVRMHAKVTVTALAPVGAANPATKSFTAQAAFWAVPWTLLAVVLALLAFGTGLWRWRKAHPSSARHRPATGNRPLTTSGRS